MHTKKAGTDKTLREFKKEAAAAGKSIHVNYGRKKVRIICDGCPMTIPYDASPARNLKVLRQALGL